MTRVIVLSIALMFLTMGTLGAGFTLSRRDPAGFRQIRQRMVREWTWISTIIFSILASIFLMDFIYRALWQRDGLPEALLVTIATLIPALYGWKVIWLMCRNDSSN